jgi:hypothetical protein
VEHLKAHLPKKGDEKTVKLEAFLQSPRKELKRKTAKMETNLRKVLETRDHVSAFLVKGSAVLARRAAEGFQFNSTLLLPHSLLLPILSTTLPLPKKGDEKTVKLEAFLQSPRKELKRKTAKMETNLRKVLETRDHVSAFLVKGSAVLARRAAEGFQFNSTLLLPHSLLLPILSTTLPILLEGYKRELLHNSMGAVLKAKHREHADVKNYLSLSLHDLATKLPQGGDSVDFYSATLLPELNGRSKAALFYLNTVLESVAEDAWRDALISVAMDHSAFGDNQQMLTHFKDLASYAEAVGSDIINFHEASKSDLHSLSAGHFLYGWWFNCPRGSGSKGSRDVKCLAPFLPSDSMAVFHQAVRLYTVPRLGLHLLVANTDSSPGGNTPRTLADVLERDRAIWNAIYSVVDPETESRGKKEKGEEEVSTEKTEESGPASEEIPPVKPTPEAEGAQSQGEGEAEGSTETPLPTPEQVPSPEPTAAGDTETQQSTRSLDEEHREKVAPTEPPEMAQETEEDRAKEAPTEMAKETGTPAPETAPPAEPTAAPETQTESEHSREKEEASTEPPETAEEAPTEPPEMAEEAPTEPPEMAEEAPTEPPEMAEENEPPTQEPVPPAQPTAATPAQGDELLEEPTAAASVTQEPVPPAQPTAATPAQEDELSCSISDTGASATSPTNCCHSGPRRRTSRRTHSRSTSDTGCSGRRAHSYACEEGTASYCSTCDRR